MLKIKTSPLLGRWIALVTILCVFGSSNARSADSITVSHDDARVNYLGNWKTEESLGPAGLPVHETAANGDFYEFTFLGTGIEVFHEMSPQAGIVEFRIDGGPVTPVNCASATPAAVKVAFRSTALAYQLHTIKAVKKSGPRMGLSGFTVMGVQRYKEAPGITFDDRARQLRAAATYNYRNDGKLGLLYAVALFDAGKDQEALKLVDDYIKIIPKIAGVNCAFSQWPAAEVYFGYNSRLTPGMREALKKELTSSIAFTGVSTGNLFAMTVIPYYLCSEAFGEAAMAQPFHVSNYHAQSQAECHDPACRFFRLKGYDWSKFHDGKGRPIFLPLNGSDVIYDYYPGSDPTGRKYIENLMIGDVVNEGLMEYNCWPYGADNILPYLTLIEHTRDKQLAHKAAIAYETILASTAANWLGGHWAAAQGRSYPHVYNQRPHGGTEMFWPYFGGAPDAFPGSNYDSMFPVFARYRMPEYIAAAAQIRSGDYVSKTNFMKRKQYTYVNRHYAVYSQFDKGWPTAFNPRFGIVPQAKRTGVVWDGAEGATILWIAHPPYSPGGTNGYGTSSRDRSTQYKGTIVQTYNITEDPKVPPLPSAPPGKPGPPGPTLFDGKVDCPLKEYAIACVPTNPLAKIDEGEKGRFFLAYNHVLIAITASVPFKWEMKPGMNRKHEIEPVSYDQIPGRQFGVAIEAASPDEYPGNAPQDRLEAFRKAILATSDPSYDPKTLTMTYTDRNGVTIESGYDGFPSRINGGVVDKEPWPEIANPWMVQPWGGNLTIFDGPDRYLYDFTRWEVSRVN